MPTANYIHSAIALEWTQQGPDGYELSWKKMDFKNSVDKVGTR
jgi:hypothetical protein